MRAAWGLGVVALVVSSGCGGGGAGGPQQAPGGSTETALVDSPDGGTTRWARRLGGLGNEEVIALAAGADGSVTLLTQIGGAVLADVEPDALGLVRLDRSGAVSWSKVLPNAQHAAFRDFSIAVSPLGNVFVALRVDCGSSGGCFFDAGKGAVSGSVLLKFEPPGNLAWQHGPFPNLASNVAVDGNGGAMFAFKDDGGTPFLRKLRWDGVRLWDVLAPQADDLTFGRWAVAFDPSANVLTGNRLALSKLDPEGRLLWIARVAASPDAAVDVASIGATAIGTVVAVLNYTGIVSFAGTTAGERPDLGGVFIAVAESDGRPRFGRNVGFFIGALGASVDPAGRLAVLTGAGFCGDTVWRWNLAGDLLWSRPVSSICNASNAASTSSVATDPTSHDVLVAGGMWGTVDFGSGPVTSRGGVDDFVVDIAP